MIDPSLTLQTAIRSALIASAAITALVPADRVRAALVRPDLMPAIVMDMPGVRILGRASGRQIAAELRAMLHIWSGGDGATIAQQIGAAVLVALLDAPKSPGMTVVEWERPELIWLRDPDPAQTFTHGVVSLRAAAQWRID